MGLEEREIMECDLSNDTRRIGKRNGSGTYES
jgi:hypothetical protein